MAPGAFFYGKGCYLALISLEGLSILLDFHLLRGSINTTIIAQLVLPSPKGANWSKKNCSLSFVSTIIPNLWFPFANLRLFSQTAMLFPRFFLLVSK